MERRVFYHRLKDLDLFDEDRNNIITLNNLKKVANELGEDLSHD